MSSTRSAQPIPTHSRRLAIGLIALSPLAAACDSTTADTPDQTASAPAIVLGADGVGLDLADTSCAIVLREVSRTPNGQGGYLTTCDAGSSGTGGSAPSSGPCRWVLSGTLDVGEGALGTPHVLYRTTESAPAWHAVKAVAADTAGRFTFTLDRFTPRPDLSGTALSRSRVELIPYLATPDGGRLFDHNRVADPLGTYLLDVANHFSIARDAACPTDGKPTWRFSYPDFEERLEHGPLVAGDTLRVAYDGRRLRAVQACMGAQGQAASTTLEVHWQVPGGDKGSAVVETLVESYGSACPNTSPCVRHEVFEPEIPLTSPGRLEAWFTCTPGFSSAPKVRYDSNDGANYTIEVLPREAIGRGVDWAGGWAIYRARPDDTISISEPLDYRGFSNMGFALQIGVYADGLTNADPVDTSILKVFIETDILTCEPGGTLVREEIALARTKAGPFGNDALYRWPFESALSRCPRGDYRFRMLISADGGKTMSPLGRADSIGEPGAEAFRTLRYL